MNYVLVILSDVVEKMKLPLFTVALEQYSETFYELNRRDSVFICTNFEFFYYCLITFRCIMVVLVLILLGLLYIEFRLYFCLV
jgi:hypothetical protein